MPISHIAHTTLNAPSDEIDLEAWLLGLSDADYQACAKGHRGAGVFAPYIETRKWYPCETPLLGHCISPQPESAVVQQL